MDLSAKPFCLKGDDWAWVAATLSGMFATEKIGQLFCLILRSEEEWKTKADELLRILPGGVMFQPFRKEVAWAAARYLQDLNRLPLLVAANLERGGSGQIKEGTNYACNMQVAATGDARFSGTQAMICAREGGAVGGNWAFAPVVDIDRNFRNPITNTRTYGDDPDTVARMGKAYVETIQSMDFAASVKHFPGDGVDERDQHLAVTVNSLGCEEWDASFGMVYRTCIESGAMSVMVGHIMLPEYSRRLSPGIGDDELLPASLSKELLGGLLRERLGFNGLIGADASTMVGMMQDLPRAEAVPLSIAAGCDMFLFTRNLEEDYCFMLADIGSEEHLALARVCADRSSTLVKSDGTLPLAPGSAMRILLYVIGDEASYGNISGGKSAYFKKKLETEGFSVSVFDPACGLEGSMKRYSEATENYDYAFYFCAMATKSNQIAVRIEWSQPMGANCPIYIPSVPTIFISMENPCHLLDVPRMRTFINAYTNTETVIDSLVEKIMGRSEFVGKNPVDPFCGRWDTHP